MGTGTLWADTTNANTTPPINTGDTAWVMICTALVFLMTIPGLALFYGGLVRRKNVLSIMMQSMAVMCLVSIAWITFGYSLAFGTGNGFIGNFDHIFFNGVGQEANTTYAATIPHISFAVFQMMFAAISPAIIIGAYAERIKFSAFCIFSVAWMALVYTPVAHWFWGVDGFLSILNPNADAAYDFAGGTVVHINAGIGALAAAIFLGRRKGFGRISPPHNLPFSIIGAALLWFGWFGFNSGSALSANGLAAHAFLTTHSAAVVGGLSWALFDWIFHKKPTVLGIISGAVAGLVAITPACGFVSVQSAFAIGFFGALLPWVFIVFIKPALNLDDSLDAFGMHGVAGIWGALAAGFFADPSINSIVKTVGMNQFWIQAQGIIITCVYSFVVTILILTLINFFIKIRVSEEEEKVGLDLTQHKESAYTVID